MARPRHDCIYTACKVLMLCCLVGASYIIDNSGGLERRFDGIGGLSGGGATSKLLVNYPESERSQILDYLFKPNFGASLQILKVEIGGDSQSTDGTESSHMHEEWDENYHRGYEWWLMVEAKKRNPNIKLYGLPWAFPGWLGGGADRVTPYGDPYKTAWYIAKWVLGAKLYYDLDIDYIGIWNERQYNKTYIKALRETLDHYYLSFVQIVAPDGSFTDISQDVMKDPDLAKAVAILGAHYPGTLSPTSAMKTGKQLWSSEDYSTFNDEVGGGCWARILNQNYVNGYMTATISWNLIASYYEALPFGRDGLMTAQEPWSGHYVVETPIWVSAHTTQFTEVGWHYLKHGSGVGKLDDGGSYVSLMSPDGKDFTMIIETMSHDHSICIRPKLPAYNVTSQVATFQLKGALAGLTTLNVWKSSLGFNGNSSKMFMQQSPLKVVNNMITLTLEVDEIYTLSTVTTAQKGDFNTPPPSAAFPLPYKDNFDSYPEFFEPFNFAPQIGVFEARMSQDEGRGMVMRQVILNHPVDWCSQKNNKPITIGGNFNWTDVYVQADVKVPMVNGTDSAFIAARISQGGCATSTAKGIFFFISPKTGMVQVSTDLAKTDVILSVSWSLHYDNWYRMAMIVKGDSFTGLIDDTLVFQGTVSPSNGFVGVGTDTFGLADFDNLEVDDSTMWKKVGSHPKLKSNRIL